MRKVLVTGASGFIGRAVVRELSHQASWDIYAIISGRRAVSFPSGVKVVAADLLDSTKVDALFDDIRPAVVIHTAWKVTGVADRRATTNLSWLESSLHILDAFIRNGGRRFMFAGSSAEYGGEGIEHGNAGSRGLKESCTVYPTCLYGVSKNVFGQVAKQILGDNDMDYLHIRIFPVYGPGEESQHAAPAAAAAAFLSGEKFVCKSPNNLWDFTYIDDVAKDIADLSKSDFIGTVNIASGVATKTADMFRLIARAAHREELLYIENAEAPIRSLVGDISLLEQVLGKRERMPIETGVREMVEWRNSANRSNGTNRRYQ